MWSILESIVFNGPDTLKALKVKIRGCILVLEREKLFNKDQIKNMGEELSIVNIAK